MMPRNFIRGVLINEIGDVINAGHAYLGFALLGVGIEFLGRALDSAHPWHHYYKGASPLPFDRAITHLFPASYRATALRKPLRNGLAHAFAPEPGLGLTDLSHADVRRMITRATHPHTDRTGQVTLVVEYLYADFSDACEQVCAMRFPRSDKMNRRFIRTDIPVRP